MNQEAVERLGALAAARRSSLMSQEDMAEKIGCSVPKLLKMEKNPADVSLRTIGEIYQSVGNDGKIIIEQFVNDFFIS